MLRLKRYELLLLVPLRGLLIHSHIVCILFSRTVVSFTCNIVCENDDDDDDE